MNGPKYRLALEALQAAHDACFKDQTRDVLGMSHGPFSGVNRVLGLVSEMELHEKQLEEKYKLAVRRIEHLESEIAALKGQSRP